MAEETQEVKKRFFVLYFDPTLPKELDTMFRERIPSLGDYFMMDKTLFLLRTESEATGIYNLFMFDHPGLQCELFIAEIHPGDGNEALFGMWGQNLFTFLGVPTAQSVVEEQQKAEEQAPAEEVAEKKPKKSSRKKS